MAVRQGSLGKARHPVKYEGWNSEKNAITLKNPSFPSELHKSKSRSRRCLLREEREPHQPGLESSMEAPRTGKGQAGPKSP